MKAEYIFKAATITAAGLSLSGCVAAAIPLVAGGALARTGTDGRDAQVTVEPPAPIKRAADDVNVAAPAAATMQDTGMSDVQVLPEEPTDLPEPSGALAFANSPALTDFVRYAGEQAFLASESGSAQLTAVLSEPQALNGERQECIVSELRQASVLIDLDTGGEPFDPDTVGLASPELALSLKVLRREAVEIAWISRNSAGSADMIRNALAESGLDAKGEDQLLLLRYPGDRKQTRRKQLALETCLLAIAGDDRSDFDELYDFLTNRDAALGLQPLFGNGWFLLDTPHPEVPAAEMSDPALPNSEEELPL